MHLDFARHLYRFPLTGRNSIRKFFRESPATKNLIRMAPAKIHKGGAGSSRPLSIYLAFHRDHLAFVLGCLLGRDHRDRYRLLRLQGRQNQSKTNNREEDLFHRGNMKPQGLMPSFSVIPCQ